MKKNKNIETYPAIPGNGPGTFHDLSGKEWLVTNGLGGFASSSLSGAHTRRYHGLLMAALEPPTRRTLLVSKVEETIVTAHHRYELSSNEYPGTIHPHGYTHLKKFKRQGMPHWKYEAGGHLLDKRVFMPHGEQATILEYANTGHTAYHLALRLFLAYRDYHHLMQASDFFSFDFSWRDARTARIQAHHDAVPFYLHFTKGEFHPERHWYYQALYRRETERGLDDREDTFVPGSVHVELAPGEKIYLVFGLDEKVLATDPAVHQKREIVRLKTIRSNPFLDRIIQALEKLEGLSGKPKALVQDLAESADQFIVERKSTNGYSLIAGYPWFTDWGRDTMIALRGLVIATGQKALAESILLTFIQYLDKGMLPNRFPDQGEKPEYNTIDASLWLFVVIHEYDEAFGDLEFIRQVFPALSEIIEHHIAGTRYRIHMTEEGLLSGGKGHAALTWMDARIGDHAFTPRHGCPVEINALWYNALRIYDALSKKIKAGKHAYAELASQVKSSLLTHFWNGHYLHDVVVPDDFADNAFRPNQLYALSLPYPLLHAKQGDQVLRLVREKLVTPFGLRTLDPEHPDFKAAYTGDPWQRDGAYHQGTVWPYLLGEYWLAYLHQKEYTKKSKIEVLRMMEPLLEHFYKEQGLMAISEVFDGLHPAAGKGCIQQAWSVGMILWVWHQVAREG